MSKLTLIVLVQNLKIRNSQGTFIFDDGGISDEWVKHWLLFSQLSSIQEKSEVSQWLNVSLRKMRADPWSKQPAQQYLSSTAPCPKNDLFPSLFFLITKPSPGLSQWSAQLKLPGWLLLGREALIVFELCDVTLLPSLLKQTTANMGTTGIQQPLTGEACIRNADALVQ